MFEANRKQSQTFQHFEKKNWRFSKKKSHKNPPFSHKILLTTLLTKYGWLVTSVPQILHSYPLWKSWFNELSGYDFLYLKDNKSVIKYYRQGRTLGGLWGVSTPPPPNVTKLQKVGLNFI